ncbi:MAG: CBS domain-containing protein [SAR202 cluster bacterium]|nr:CBS domain-containing protein [SAR202 cluster bacterium]
MNNNLKSLPKSASIWEAANMMRENDIGDVVVIGEDSKILGIVTDRDIVVRAIAQGKDPSTTKLEEITSKDLVTVSSTDDADQAVRLMREKAIRRLPVVDGDRPVGFVSIGDLALAKDRESALADISGAPPNR